VANIVSLQYISIKKMKILVSGGTGYIGSHTCVDLLDKGFEPVIIDNAYNSYFETINKIKAITGKDVKYYNLDLCDKKVIFKVFEQEKFDGVIHFAALKAVGESMEIPFKYFHNNNTSLLNTLEAAHLYGVKAFIFSSSCTVYGDVKESPVTEDTPMQEAASVYGRTKQMGEQIINDVSHLVNYKSILLRYFNPAGAHPSGLMGENPKNEALNLVPVIMETANGKRPFLKIYGTDYPTRDGSCIRDYVHVMDLAHAHTLALQNVIEGKQTKKVEVYNLGIGNGVSVLEAINAFKKVTGILPNYQLAPRRSGDIAAIYSNFEKAKIQLGWQPKYTIDDIMSTAWAWENNKT
jgi:UDP-glucose 4-epimerase